MATFIGSLFGPGGTAAGMAVDSSAAASAAAAAPAVTNAAVTTASVGAGAAAAGSGFSIGSILSGAFTVAGALGSLFAANQKQDSFSFAADTASVQAQQAYINGELQAAEIKKNLLRTVASQNAAYAASGIDLSSGTPVAVQRATRETAERQVQVVRDNAQIARASSQQRQGSLLAQADAEYGVGLIKAAVPIGEFVSSRFVSS